MSEFKKMQALVQASADTLTFITKTHSSLLSSEITFQDAALPSSTLTNLRDTCISTGDINTYLNKCKKKLNEVDSVTGEETKFGGGARYGENMKKNVIALIEQFNLLVVGVEELFNANGVYEGLCVVESKFLSDMKAEEEEKVKRDLDNNVKSEANRKGAIKIAEDNERLAINQENLRIYNEKKAKADALAYEKAEKKRLEDEAEQIKKTWLSTITVSGDGLKEQIRNIREGCTLAEAKIAIKALHTLFEQMVARPEEDNYRKIKKDHVKYHQDLGRHAGGNEALIASGFSLVTIDEVGVFIMAEPNLEKDIEKWSEWFDNIKLCEGILGEYV